jgi:hypothetical protein
MSIPSADVFTKISDAKEKFRIFDDFNKVRGEVQAKLPDPSSDLFILRTVDLDKRWTCHLVGPSVEVPNSGKLTLSFFLGGEKYFMNFSYQRNQNIFSFDYSEPIYHLQRREDYRLKIPASYRALLENSAVNGKAMKFSALIADLSAGGCRVSLDLSLYALKVHDEVRGHIFLPDRSPIEFIALLKHQRPDPAQKGLTICGLQFINQSSKQKNRIAALVMDLYREFFTRP